MRFTLCVGSLYTASTTALAIGVASMVGLGGLGCSGDAPQTSTVTDPLTGAGGGSVPEAPVGVPSIGGDLMATETDLSGLIDGDPQPPACSDVVAPAAARPPLIQLVVDTSGSMGWVAGTQRAPKSGEQSKWQITQQALASAIAAMPDDAAVGLSYFPNTQQGDATCYKPEVAAPIAPLDAGQRALIEQVNTAESPSGGTPTHAAYEFGVQQLQASQLDGPRFLLLITDGTPTYTLDCHGDGRTRVDGAPLVEDVKTRYQDSQIRTFVIGSPGSEDARDELSEMASVGGTGSSGCDVNGPDFCHFDMTTAPDFSQGLNRALSEITRATLACDYAVPAPPGGLHLDFNDASVVLASGGSNVREFTQAASSDCAAGWQYAPDRSSLHLCPSTCTEVQDLLSQDPGIEVRIKFGCSTTLH